jgi:tetratricopeptide (TPR) repeat protein
LVRAGDRAKALFANQEALALYAAALERAHDGEGPHAAASLLERMGDVQALIGRNDEAIASLRAARDRTSHLVAATGARRLRKIGTALRIQGAYQAAASVFAEALEVLPGEDDAEAAQIRLQIGQLSWRTADYTAAQAVLPEP